MLSLSSYRYKSASIFRMMIRCITCGWFQQCKKRSRFNPFLLNTRSCYRRNVEYTCIKKTDQFNSFKVGDNQLLDRMKLLSGATGLEGKQNFKNKGYFPHGRFDHPDELQNTELRRYDPFYSILHSRNPLEVEYKNYVNFFKRTLNAELAVMKTKLSQPPLKRV